MKETESWRPAPGYEGLYEVSDYGAVRSLNRPHRRGQLLRQSPASKRNDYRVVSLSREGSVRQWRVHQLVALALIGPCPAELEVCHDNGRASDNRLSNLRYDTHSSNQRDIARHGTHRKASQTHCQRGHAFTEENTYLTALNQRRCRECHREDRRAGYREATADRGRIKTPTSYPGEFCKHKHEYTTENTYIDPAGKRWCRECRRAVLRRQHYKRKAAKSGCEDTERGDGGRAPS